MNVSNALLITVRTEHLLHRSLHPLSARLGRTRTNTERPVRKLTELRIERVVYVPKGIKSAMLYPTKTVLLLSASPRIAV